MRERTERYLQTFLKPSLQRAGARSIETDLRRFVLPSSWRGSGRFVNEPRISSFILNLFILSTKKSWCFVMLLRWSEWILKVRLHRSPERGELLLRKIVEHNSSSPRISTVSYYQRIILCREYNQLHQICTRCASFSDIIPHPARHRL